MDFSLWLIVWCAIALWCGGLIKGTLGVGTPLLTVPMLTLVLPPQTAIAIMAVPVVVANIWQSLGATGGATKGHAVIRTFWPTIAGILAGTATGTRALSMLDDKPLMLVVGCIIVSFTLLQRFNRQFYLPDTWVMPAGLVFGFVAGLIGGISSMFGPMIIIYLMSIKDLGKDKFVKVISVLYLCAVIPWAIQLYYHGILDQQLLWYSVLGTAPVAVGMLSGQTLRAHVSESLFKVAILCILLVSGATMFWRAFQ